MGLFEVLALFPKANHKGDIFTSLLHILRLLPKHATEPNIGSSKVQIGSRLQVPLLLLNNVSVNKNIY